MGLHNTRNGVYVDACRPVAPFESACSWNNNMAASEKIKYRQKKPPTEINMLCDGYNIFYERKGSSHYIDVFGRGVGFVSSTKEGVFKQFRNWTIRHEQE